MFEPKTMTLIPHLERATVVWDPPTEEEAAAGKLTGRIRTSEVLIHYGYWKDVPVELTPGEPPVMQRVFFVPEAGLPRHVSRGDFDDMVPNGQQVFVNAGDELAFARKGLKRQVAERDAVIDQQAHEIAAHLATIEAQTARLAELQAELAADKKRIEDGIAREKQLAMAISAIEEERAAAQAEPTHTGAAK